MTDQAQTNDSKYWFWGLAIALISGAANAVTIYIVKPAEFNLGEQWTGLVAYAVLSALVAAGMYMQDPSPPTAGSLEGVDWAKWAKGLVAAMIGGSVNTLSVFLLAQRDVDPEAMMQDWKQLSVLALVALVTSGAAYLKKQPIPSGALEG